MAAEMKVTDEAVEAAARVVAIRAGENFELLSDFARNVLLETQRAALEAGLAAMLEPVYQIRSKVHPTFVEVKEKHYTQMLESEFNEDGFYTGRVLYKVNP